MCFFCACNKIVTKHHERSAEYLRYLNREIDLHIEHLIETDSLLSAHDKFLLQINTFKRFTNQMILKKTPRFIVIHGVGEGKLIQEIRFLVHAKEGFSIHDANYSARGVGASYIEIKLSIAKEF